MNNGKICISINARSADELSREISQALEIADVIEIRFDLLNDVPFADVLDLLETFPSQVEFLATSRPTTEGYSTRGLQERIFFWRAVLESNRFAYIDLEEDLVFALTYNDAIPQDLLGSVQIVGSHHDFFASPPDLGPVLKVFEPNSDYPFRCNIVKIAARAHSITDTIEQWYLLNWAKHHGLQSVPISMGEPGKWTRILGLAHGSFMTYAALDEDTKTAPGQISAHDLIDVYRVKDLDRETEVYGVIAGDTSYSLSPIIHNAAFKAAGMNRVFVPLQVGELGEFIRRMVLEATRDLDLNFRGFAVTNPHKQAIRDYLDEIDETGGAVGAVNTVKIENAKLLGYNTDAAGFIAPLLDRYGDLRGSRAIVLGSGGAARACVYALKQNGAEIDVLARDSTKAQILADEFGVRHRKFEKGSVKIEADILINATPLGTKGKLENDTPATADQLAGVKLVYDLTYNPRETRLFREAKAAGCDTLDGLSMLIAQGAKQFEIWTGVLPDIGAMRNAALRKLNNEKRD